MGEQGSIKKFDKYLFKIDVRAMAFGCIVGWDAFVMPETTFLPAAGHAETMISMVMSRYYNGGRVHCFLLNGKIPRTGGIYSYTKEAFGHEHDFLCFWFLCLSYLSIVFLNRTALFLVIRTIKWTLQEK